MNLTSETDPLGNTTSYNYDANGRRTSVTDALQHTMTSAYDAAGQLVSTTDANGHETTYTYDGLGRLTTKTLPGSSVDSHGNPVPETYSYNYFLTNIAKPGSVRDPSGYTISYLYNINHQVGYQYDSNTYAPIYYTYDANGNLTSSFNPAQQTTTNVYDERNRLVSQTQPGLGTASTTYYTYDDHSQLTAVKTPSSDQTSSRQNMSNITLYAYDKSGNLASMTDPLGHTANYQYNTEGELVQDTDRNGRIRQFTHDPDGRKTSEQWMPIGGGAPFHTITTTYDANGRTIGVADPVSQYAYGYNSVGNLTTDDNAGTPGLPRVVLTSAYDPAGNRTSLSDSLGGEVDSTYDARNEVTRITQSGSGIAPERVDFAYDPAGDRTSLTRYSDLAGYSPVVTTTYGYDGGHRLTNLTHSTATGSVEASYGYSYDNINRLTQEIRNWTAGSSSASDTLNYSYVRFLNNPPYIDGSGQLFGVTHSNSAFANETFGYDANGNRTTAGNSTKANNQLASDGTYKYNYDNEGNLITKTDQTTGQQTIYSWDYRNRLVGVDQGTATLDQDTPARDWDYTADATSYLQVPSGTYDLTMSVSGLGPNATNHIRVSANGEDYSNGPTTVDLATASGQFVSRTIRVNIPYGNLYLHLSSLDGVGSFAAISSLVLSPVGGSGSLRFDYGTPTSPVAPGYTKVSEASNGPDYWFGSIQSYDGGPRIAASPSSTTPVVRYVYDALDRRIDVTTPTSSIRTVYDGTSPLIDFDGNSNGSSSITARYLSGPAVDELLSRQTPQGGVAWYLTDRQGTVRDIADDSGNVIDHIDYGAFGAILAQSNPSQGDRFGYAGMQTDAETGLYFDQARYYDPASGRFVSQDPMGFSAGDVNLYRYVGNQPINAVDPSGEFSNVIAGAAIGGAIGLGVAVYNNWGDLGGALNDGSLFAGAASGVVGGAVAGATFGAASFYYGAEYAASAAESWGITAAAGAIGSLAGYAASNAAAQGLAALGLGADPGPLTPDAAANSAVLGAGFSLLGRALAPAGRGLFCRKPPTSPEPGPAAGAAPRDVAPKGETQSIYKAPQAGEGQKQLTEGYHPDDFPATQGSDGKAYFAKEKSIADEYAPHGPYGEGVVEVQVPKDVYDARLRQYEQPYQGGPRTELPIPPKEFDVLNNSPRKLHP